MNEQGEKQPVVITPEMAAILARPDEAQQIAASESKTLAAVPNIMVAQPVVASEQPIVMAPIASPASDPQMILEKVTIPRPDKQHHFIAAFMFSFYFGWLGADRFYLGKYLSAIIKLLTLGGFGIWAMIDTKLIMSGATKDKWGNPLIDVNKYQKFAKQTRNWTYLMFLFLFIVVVGSIYLTWPLIQPLINQLNENINVINQLGGSSSGVSGIRDTLNQITGQ